MTLDLSVARTGIIRTIHHITKDVVNPCAPLADRRMRGTFLQIPVINAGCRVRITHDFTYNRSDYVKEHAFNSEYAVVRLIMLSPVPCTDEFTWYEFRQLGEETAKIEILSKSVKDDASSVDRRRNQAREAFGMALIAALSQPVEDFDSEFEIERYPDHEDVLRRIWLEGLVTMEQIKACRHLVRVQQDAEYEEQERARKEARLAAKDRQ